MMLYRALYITIWFLAIKVVSMLADISVAELCAYTAIVIIADNYAILRAKKLLEDLEIKNGEEK